MSGAIIALIAIGIVIISVEIYNKFLQKKKSDVILGICIKPSPTLTKDAEYIVKINGNRATVINDYGDSVSVLKSRFDIKKGDS